MKVLWVLLLHLITTAFGFNIFDLFEEHEEDEHHRQYHSSRSSQTKRQNERSGSVDECEGYVCPGDGKFCAPNPIDCPCLVKSEIKCRQRSSDGQDWYVCVNGGYGDVGDGHDICKRYGLELFSK